MKKEQKTKKSFFAMLRESFGKTGGCCCGPGEMCCGPNEGADKVEIKEVTKRKEARQAAQNQQ